MVYIKINKRVKLSDRSSKYILDLFENDINQKENIINDDIKSNDDQNPAKENDAENKHIHHDSKDELIK